MRQGLIPGQGAVGVSGWLFSYFALLVFGFKIKKQNPKGCLSARLDKYCRL